MPGTARGELLVSFPIERQFKESPHLASEMAGEWLNGLDGVHQRMKGRGGWQWLDHVEPTTNKDRDRTQSQRIKKQLHSSEYISAESD